MDPIENDKKNDIDHWLDEALHEYGRTEPRAGLESRLLATLEVERNRKPVSRRWWWAFGTFATAGAIVAVMWVAGSGGGKNRPQSTAGLSTTVPGDECEKSIPPSRVAQVTPPAKQTGGGRPATQPVRAVAPATTPKLDQFPSPQPLSEQEQLLMRYVARYPESAVLVARARAETLQRDREEEARMVNQAGMQ